MSALLLGLALTFADSDGRALHMTVALTEPGVCALEWGSLSLSSTTTSIRHRFGPLPIPAGDAPFEYELRPGSDVPRRDKIEPIRPGHPLKIAIYGDSRDGTATHEVVAAAIDRARPNVVIHTGDVIRTSEDEDGLAAHFRATLALAARSPVVLALGNHELIRPPERWGDHSFDPLERMLGWLPPAADPLRERHKAPRAAFQVRVGPVLIVSIDSNSPLGPGSPQRKYLEAALDPANRGDAKFVLVAMHHGPLSSGPHGPHRESEGIPELFTKARVTASIAGHDHVYERLVHEGVTYLVSGGGGAPLYYQLRAMPGSIAFAATYNWVMLTVDGDKASIEAYSLEGAVIDRAQIAPLDHKQKRRIPHPRLALWVTVLAVLTVLGCVAWVASRMAFAKRAR